MASMDGKEHDVDVYMKIAGRPPRDVKVRSREVCDAYGRLIRDRFYPLLDDLPVHGEPIWHFLHDVSMIKFRNFTVIITVCFEFRGAVNSDELDDLFHAELAQPVRRQARETFGTPRTYTVLGSDRRTKLGCAEVEFFFPQSSVIV